MKHFLPLLLSLLVLEAHAQLPVKRSMIEMKPLWENSPFTTKPEVEAVDQKNELEDWSLAGVSSNPQGGYTVTIVNKKDRGDRRRIHSSGNYQEEEVKGFKIMEVSQEGLNYKETKVKLSVSGQEGWVGYDEKILAVKPANPIANNRPGVPQPRTFTQNTQQNSNIQSPGVQPNNGAIRTNYTPNNTLTPQANAQETPQRATFQNGAGIPNQTATGGATLGAQNNVNGTQNQSQQQATEPRGAPLPSSRRPRIRRVAPTQ